MDNKRNDLDELLDAALAKYSQAEPRPRLEDRVLAGLRARPQAAAWAWWNWAAVAVTAAVLIASVSFYYGRESAQPSVARTPAPPVEVARPAPPPALVTQRAAMRRASPPAAGEAAAAPRREQFPSPAPLSEQEQLLFWFVSLNPGEVEAAVESSLRAQQKLKIENLQIPRLAIEPLKPAPPAPGGKGGTYEQGD